MPSLIFLIVLHLACVSRAAFLPLNANQNSLQDVKSRHNSPLLSSSSRRDLSLGRPSAWHSGSLKSSNLDASSDLPDLNTFAQQNGLGTLLQGVDLNKIASDVFGKMSENRYMILLRENITDAELTEHLKDANLTSIYRGIVSEFNYKATQWKGYIGYFPQVVIDYLKTNALVQLVEADGPISKSGARPLSSILSGSNYVGSDGFNSNKVLKESGSSWNLARISSRNSTDTTTFVYPSSSGENIDVYIVDTGIYLQHDEFEGRAIWGTWVTENGTSTSIPTNGDDEGHGTNVAGIVAGKTYGVSKKSRVIAVKVLDKTGNGLVSTIVAGIQWAINNTATTNRRSVINMSLGGASSTGSSQESTILNRAIKSGMDRGILFTVAAGNDNKDACSSTPANSPDAFTVGSIDNLDFRSNFSNYGSCVSIYAPGSSIPAAYIPKSTGDKSSIALGSGTSQACPHVAGVMALILGENKNATWQEVYSMIFQAATYGKLKGLMQDDPNLLLYTGFDGISGNSSLLDVKNSNNTNSVVPSLQTLASSNFWSVVLIVLEHVWL
ncbi:serine protease [Nowakowskiella sp. JEL0078]|nr:serine protease [Nowakowskiella sp. JEL0078]